MSLEELEAEAQQTGDWSKVEKREQALARFNSRFTSNNYCDAGETPVCSTVGGMNGLKECQCRQGSFTNGARRPPEPLATQTR